MRKIQIVWVFYEDASDVPSPSPFVLKRAELRAPFAVGLVEVAALALSSPRFL